jgi:hypothetical protein
MLPLPSAARGLRADIAEKPLFISLREKGGTTELPLPGEPEAKLPLQLQQAAKTRAAQPAYAILVSFLVVVRNGPTLLP